MAIFPSGAWFLEPEFPDPLAWLVHLERIPVFTASTRCRGEIRRLSSCTYALALPAMESEIEDEDDSNDDGEAEQDELESEDPPVTVKAEKASSSKKKGDAIAVVENEKPVSSFRSSLAGDVAESGFTS
jgi:hypothetical protein